MIHVTPCLCADPELRAAADGKARAVAAEPPQPQTDFPDHFEANFLPRAQRLLRTVAASPLSDLKAALTKRAALAKEPRGTLPLHALLVAAGRGSEAAARCRAVVDAWRISPGSVGVDPLTRQSPLHRAAAYGRADCVGYLLDLQCSVHDNDTCGHTPLYCACATEKVDNVALLLECQSDIGHRDTFFRTPVEVAEVLQRQLIVDLLRPQASSADEEKPYALVMHDPANGVELLPGSRQFQELMSKLRRAWPLAGRGELPQFLKDRTGPYSA
eukprot:TRINITY_DN5967_c0_g1_i10.p2 TRINITY_DN5967_c0_g1~~TRINITY_DN5967_c0_g1_i10.p2  ORF type:complete len:272 (+),score=46.38 TRINITY_DN5967_c0_g1_i10:2205-3020(+)